MSKFVNVNNEPNVKLPEHKIKCICDSCDEIRAYAEDYALDAIALNAPGVDVKGAVAEDYLTHHHDFRKACEIARDASTDDADRTYWQHQINVLDRIKTNLAPTGSYGVATELYDALTELVYHDGNKWRVGIIPDADVTDIVGAVMTKAARSLAEEEQ